MRVLIFLLVVLMLRISFIKNLDVVVPGAGIVERNTALRIMTRSQVNACPTQKTIIMPCVVGLKRDSRKRSIVLEGILRIVVDAGKQILSLPRQ